MNSSTETRPDATPDPQSGFIATCQRLAGFDERWDAEWFDGVLTALATSTRPPPLDEVLAVLAGDSFEHCFGDPDDAASARTELQRRWDEITAALNPQWLYDDPDRLHLAPLILDAAPTDDGAAASPVGAYWASGFHDGMRAFPAHWPEEIGGKDAAALEKLMHTIAALSHPDRSDGRGRNQLIDDAAFAAQDLRLLWLDQAVSTPPLQAAPKVGRNDLCPCGSGKKFKKCHGA